MTESTLRKVIKKSELMLMHFGATHCWNMRRSLKSRKIH